MWSIKNNVSKYIRGEKRLENKSNYFAAVAMKVECAICVRTYVCACFCNIIKVRKQNKRESVFAFQIMDMKTQQVGLQMRSLGFF